MQRLSFSKSIIDFFKSKNLYMDFAYRNGKEYYFLFINSYNFTFMKIMNSYSS